MRYKNYEIPSTTNPNVLICFRGGGKPDDNYPAWDIDIETPDYSHYCTYMDKYARDNTGKHTRSQLEDYIKHNCN